MTTILVWVAILYTGDKRGAHAVVDNIASKQECERIVVRAGQLSGWTRGTCTQYRKVVTK